MPNVNKSPQAKGGKARAEKLSAKERKDVATNAANQRWQRIKQGLPSAQFEGVLKINDTELEVAVLNNGKRIISQTSVFKALGRPSRGVRATLDGEIILPAFMDAANLVPYINEDLMEVIKRERYLDNSGVELEGYDASILPLVCDAYLKAREDGALKTNQTETAKKAEILVRSLAKVGIIALVDEATGYQEIRPKAALQAYLDKIISKELAAWAKKFPDEFYENIYKLKNWPWSGMSKNRFSVVAHYTRDLVYERLGDSILQELEKKTPKQSNGQRKNKLHQWFTDDVGNPMLAQHLHSLIMVQRLAIANGYGWNRFIKMVDQVMPRKGGTFELELNDTTL
ncbi:P63C domain-containing protein [Cronobacter sakazakii]|uniref:P63C domain-containing protein n=3 Tax=Cronobacter sakazakii TaxID=28141 RepID=UPI000CFD1ED6|nr:P63C domain-containing protein [Cronobacter sakazakii]ELY2648473.1 P63C domain-containing protein [Cronobacter sakazakii]ELY2669298.1 P63C domain-containing protein [Cronobacter sakazakii]ELY2685624.1 P63C domain-containing protein [Cronobacter sakazakii]ELY2727236.1 P63C domain-containing protein [Cronobacter sakazakii]ELY2758504.1 P63C domain-containing protein [Cronobacter sakazakii]